MKGQAHLAGETFDIEFRPSTHDSSTQDYDGAGPLGQAVLLHRYHTSTIDPHGEVSYQILHIEAHFDVELDLRQQLAALHDTFSNNPQTPGCVITAVNEVFHIEETDPPQFLVMTEQSINM